MDYRFGSFRLAASARELWQDGALVTLPRRVFDCLACLVEHRDRAVGRDELVTAIWGRLNVSDAQLGQIVLRARRVLGDDGQTQHSIRTIPGFGYRWVADIEPATAFATDASTHIAPPDASDRSTTQGDASPPTHAPAVASTDITRELAPATPAAPARRRNSRAWFAVPVLLVLLIVAAAFAIHLRHGVQAPATPTPSVGGDAVMVLPLDVKGSRDDAWVRLGGMDLIATRLRMAGLPVPPSENVLVLVQAAGKGGAAADGNDVDGAAVNGTDVDGRTLRALTGARLVVRGTATRTAEGWRVELAAIAADCVTLPAQYEQRDIVAAARGAADRLLAALGRVQPGVSSDDIGLQETLQRARAAMLANHLDAARSILAGAPELAQAPLQLRYRLAQVDFREGKLKEADAALTALLAEPRLATDALLHAQVLNARGTTRIRAGRFADGGRDFDATLAVLPASGDNAERGDALGGRGVARIVAHQFEPALADLGAARVHLESAGDALGVTRVDANLGMLELYRGRPSEALAYLDGAAGRFESFGALHELLITLSGIVDAQLSLLQRKQAAATMERGWTLRDRITDPDQWVDLALNRAEILMGRGQYREAATLLSDARIDTASVNRVLNARSRAVRAELAMRQQRWSDAAEFASAALADWPAQGTDGDREQLLLTDQRALLALGRIDQAGALLDRTRAPPDLSSRNLPTVNPPSGNAPSENAPSNNGGVAWQAIAMAQWFEATQQPALADDWFRAAFASAEQRGVPDAIVAAVDAYAPKLIAAGDLDGASALIGRVAPWAAEDFDCALLQLRLYHALARPGPWSDALGHAEALAGERAIPAELKVPPRPASPSSGVKAAGARSGLP